MKDAKLVKKEVVFHKFKKVVQDTITLPDGKQLEWIYLDIPSSVLVVTLTADRQIVLEKLYRYNLKQHVYENPAGAVEEDEKDMPGAARRELLEETGYVPGRLVDLGKFYVLPGDTNRWVNIFLSLDSRKVEEPKLDHVIEQYFDISVHLFNFEEIADQLKSRSSPIVGLEHAYAITLAHDFISQNVSSVL